MGDDTLMTMNNLAEMYRHPDTTSRGGIGELIQGSELTPNNNLSKGSANQIIA